VSRHHPRIGCSPARRSSTDRAVAEDAAYWAAIASARAGGHADAARGCVHSSRASRAPRGAAKPARYSSGSLRDRRFSPEAVLATASGHYVMKDRPDLVLAAIAKMVGRARN